MRSDYYYPEWLGLAPTPSFLRTLLAIFVATAVGAVSGIAVVLSLLSALTAETQSGVMQAKKIVEAAASGAPQEGPQPTPRPEFNQPSVATDRAGAVAVGSQDVSASISRSEPSLARAVISNDQLAPARRETTANGGVTSASGSVEQQARTQFDRRQRHFVARHRGIYSRRFANAFLNLPLPRRW
jgi:hypothetical protein